MYNLVHILEREDEIGDTKAIIKELQKKIEAPMKTLYSKETTNNKGKNKRKRLDGGIGDRGAGRRARGGGTTDCAELRAHDYNVEPEDIVDESGGVFKAFFKVR